MIIHPPEFRTENGETLLAARVETATRIPGLPAELWYKFSPQYKDFISANADAFVTALVLFAMQLGEDIEVGGPVSPRLIYGLREYTRIFNLWFPQILRPIEISATDYQVLSPQDVAGGVGAAFSGGVDSFYTVWAHLPQNQPIPEARLTHAVYMYGLDHTLRARSVFESFAERYRKALKEYGVELLTMETNVRQFIGNRIQWDVAYGSATIAGLLLFGGLFQRAYISSGFRYDATLPIGSTPLTDHWLSTERMPILHFGSSVTRFEKIQAIAAWPTTWNNIRVCWQETDAKQNCGRCHKCERTLAMLKLTGELSHHTNFVQPFTRRQFRRHRLMLYQKPDAARMMRFAREHGHRAMVLDLSYINLMSRLEWFREAWIQRMARVYRKVFRRRPRAI